MNWRTSIVAFIDSGRILVDREEAGPWHTAPGLGFEFSALESTFRLTYAHGPEGRVYFGSRAPLTR